MTMRGLSHHFSCAERAKLTGEESTASPVSSRFHVFLFRRVLTALYEKFLVWVERGPQLGLAKRWLSEHDGGAFTSSIAPESQGWLHRV